MSAEKQEELLRYWCVIEDLRRRNGELSTALQESDMEAFDRITPAGFYSRANTLDRLLSECFSWLREESDDGELREAIEAVQDYLPLWAVKVNEGKQKAKKRLETMAAKDA